jgi:D-alanyl-D-alanine carboxypeptidase/Putative peptidoglycan binding domain
MIKVLLPGSTGSFVTQWQTFLRGQGFQVDATGSYDATTVAATVAFQKRWKLDPDGRVGNQTLGKAGMLGLEIVDSADLGMGYPALPPFEALTSTAERQALFGPLEFTPAPTADNREALRITNGWDRSSLAKLTVPELVGVKGGGTGTVYFHTKAQKQLLALWKAWGKKGLLPKVLSYEGAFNPRFVRGQAPQQVLSNHAFGTAFDINYAWNKLGAEPATPADDGCVYELVPIAHQFGFYWGGHFSRKDGMHFEVAQLQ